MGWAQEEFETIDLSDERLNRRAVLPAERFGQKPGAGIPAACGNWTETAAACRFLRNEQVGWNDVLTARAQASRARIREHVALLPEHLRNRPPLYGPAAAAPVRRRPGRPPKEATASPPG